MNEHDAKKALEDVRARRSLWAMLWKASHEHEEGRPTPSPPPDEYIQEDLDRILNPKKKRFFGLF